MMLLAEIVSDVVFFSFYRYYVPYLCGWNFQMDHTRGCSSAGRALRSQRRGRRFDPDQLHMCFGYILRSIKTGNYYIGHTEDVGGRLEEHNSGRGGYTGTRGPWELVFRKTFRTRAEAMRWERALKGRKSRKYVEGLIAEWRRLGERPVTI
jgi:putative endonuclease